MVCTLLSASLLVGRSAFAAKPLSKERLAKQACLSGDYAKGVVLLADLFVETRDPNHLYNQGRCYERNARYIEAAERYKEYRRKDANLSSADKADVDKRIADCEAAAARGQARNQTSSQPAQPLATHQSTPATAPVAAPPAKPPTPPAAAPSSPPASAAKAPTPPTAALSSPPASTVGEAEHPWQHTAKWVATGAAVAFLGFAVIEHATYYGKNTDYNKKDCTDDPSGCQSLADTADKAQILAIIGYGAAAVATGLAITFWLTDSPKAGPTPQTGIGFSCAPMLAGVSCLGHF